MKSALPSAGYRFDDVEVDARNRTVRKGGENVSLSAKYFDVLVLLLERRGELVTKQSIFESVWSGVFVTDAALTQCIKEIRRLLGDDAADPRYIKTVPKHGYVFIAAAEVFDPSEQSRHAVTTPAPRPYKFLDYYTERDAHLFFGREDEIETLASRIASRRSLVLYGRSGVGKSSLVRAGIAPRLGSAGHRVVIIRSFADPLRATAAALGADAGSEPIENALETAARSAGKLVLVFDPFEELFTVVGCDSRARFVDALGRAYRREDLNVAFVFVLREELLAEMSRLKGAIPEIFHHEYRLERLGREAASRAVREPARTAGVPFDPVLVEKILDDLAERGAIDPPQLQIVCDRLYDRRDRSGRITLSTYEDLGGAAGILKGYLERVLERFRPAERRRARALLGALVAPDGSRIFLQPREAGLRAGVAPADVDATLDELVDARLVRRGSERGEPWIELAHDFLVGEVTRQLDAEDRAFLQARGILSRALENYRAHRLLLDAETLQLLIPYGARLALAGEEADLIVASQLERGPGVAAWAVRTAPHALELTGQACRHSDPEVRQRAVGALLELRDRAPEASAKLLGALAMGDRVLNVRRSACAAIAAGYPAAAGSLIENRQPGSARGLRRAFTLALLRESDAKRVPLSKLGLADRVAVVGALAWVRILERAGTISRQGLGGTAGGALAGLVGSLLLGAALLSARGESFIDGIPLLAVLATFGAAVGAIGGCGVSFGLAAAAAIGHRHSRWWGIAGGAAGGAAIGGVAKIFGIDALDTLFGHVPSGVTGAFEGLVVGVGLTFGLAAAGGTGPKRAVWRQAAGAAAGSMAAGLTLSLLGGNLFSGSLQAIARAFTDARVGMDPLAQLVGEPAFGRLTQAVLGGIEGLLFGAGTAAGMALACRRARPRTEQVGSAS